MKLREGFKIGEGTYGVCTRREAHDDSMVALNAYGWTKTTRACRARRFGNLAPQRAETRKRCVVARGDSRETKLYLVFGILI